MSDNSLLQNLYHCTIQLCHPETHAIAGTGVVLAPAGYIATSRHVLRLAGSIPLHAPGDEVDVLFPQVPGSEPTTCRARVVAALPYLDDALILLQVAADMLPLPPEYLAVPAAADTETRRQFRSFGYWPTGGEIACSGEGEIVEGVEPVLPQDAPMHLLRLYMPDGEVLVPGAAVLDSERNLVVGIVCAAAPDDAVAGECFAFDARMLAAAPFHLPLREEPFPLRPTPQPRTDIDAARGRAVLVAGADMYAAPPAPGRQFGHDETRRALNSDWTNPTRRVAALVGESGEGTTSLARTWLGHLLRDQEQTQPDGVFWWSFHANPRLDAFFEAALQHLGGRFVDIHQYPSTSARAQVVGAMLRGGRYLLVLDGVDAWQHQAFPCYGELRSADLRDFLGYAAAPGHRSFCLLTSTTPLVDMLDQPGYVRYSLRGLAAADARDLLAAHGVRGSSFMLDQLVADLEAHPLTISLFGAYLVERHWGMITDVDRLLPLSNVPRPERIRQIVASRLREAPPHEHRLLALLSVFRLPIDEAAVNWLFRVRPGLRERLLGKKSPALLAPFHALSDEDLNALLQLMQALRLLLYHPQACHYRLHPLVHAQAAAYLTEIGDPDEVRALHLQVRDYYLSQVGRLPRYVSMHDLEPLIEAVYHSCCAGLYDEAWQIYHERIEQGEARVFQQMGASETLLALMRCFFGSGPDTPAPVPRVSDRMVRNQVFDTVVSCLMSLRRPREAVAMFAARNAMLWDDEDWNTASVGYRTQAVLQFQAGNLADADHAAEKALTAARHLESPRLEVAALAQQAWLSHLRGNIEAAGEMFRQAAALQQQTNPEQPDLFSQDRIWYADHLREADQPDEARAMTQANLALCAQHGWVKSLSQCHRLLGDLDAAAGEHDAAYSHYDEALRIARNIDHRPTLAETLLARGRQAIQQEAYREARTDLNEALGYTLEGGYRIAEAEIRMALALLERAMDDPTAAQAQERYARYLSAATGYRLLERAV